MPRTQTADKYSYVIDWINEAIEVRGAQNAYVERSVLAYQGQPAINRYRQQLNSFIEVVARSDAIRANLLRQVANDIPEIKSMAVHNAVETVVSMAQGGVGRYEFGPYDPDMEQDDETIDMLSSAAKHFYNTEKVDAIMPIYIRNAVLSGAAYLHVKPRGDKKLVTILDSSNVLTDPKRFKTNHERFRGFTQRESWAAIKGKIKRNRGGAVLKVVGDVDVYLSQLFQEMNSVNGANPAQDIFHERLRRDLDIFYRPLTTLISEKRLLTTDKGGDPNYSYYGDEIEMTYLYDMMNDMYFEVVNRRYIVVAKTNPLRRSITSEFTDHKGATHKVTKEIRLDHTIIELPYIKTFWDAYPISPLFYVLDDFDNLCAQESVLYHNQSIKAPITFVGSSNDGEKVGKVASIAGEVIDGMPQTFKVLDKTHDDTPLLTAIQRAEDKIKRALKATDPFEMQAILGDRASAKEVTSLSGQISQGLNPFIANIETAMAELGEVFMKLQLIFGDHDKPYSFVHNGRYAELEASSMAADYEIVAKMTSAIKLEQEANSRKALELIQYLGQSEDIDKKEFLGIMLPIVFAGTVNREQGKRMVNEKYRPLPEETIAEIRRREEERAKRDPIDNIDLSGLSAEELDSMLGQTTVTGADPNAYFDGGDAMIPGAQPVGPEEDPAIVDPAQQPVAADPAAPGTMTIPVGNGLPSGIEAGGEEANNPARTI